MVRYRVPLVRPLISVPQPLTKNVNVDLVPEVFSSPCLTPMCVCLCMCLSLCVCMCVSQLVRGLSNLTSLDGPCDEQLAKSNSQLEASG